MKNLILNEGYQNNKNLFDKGLGSKIFTNKKTFVDLSSGQGTLLLGHNNRIFRSEIKNFLSLGISNFSAPNKHAVNFSNNLRKVLPEFSNFIFCNSGAEAIIKSIRIARAITKKNLIINASGSWHGSVDQFLYYSNKKNRPIELSDGLDERTKKNLIYIPYNDVHNSLKVLKKFSKKACCLIVEPIQGCLPSKEGENYIRFLYKFCKKNNLILIFDEMATGLRINCSSVQNQTKTPSDIITFGKAFSNGLPMGVIGISKKIYNKIQKKKIKVFFGGTYTANSMSMYIGNKMLIYFIKNKKKIFNRLEFISNKFEKEINNFIEKNNIDAKIIRYHSILRLLFSKKHVANRLQRDFLEKKSLSKVRKFRNFLLKKKIYYPTNGIMFMSTSLTTKDANSSIEVFKDALVRFFKR